MSHKTGIEGLQAAALQAIVERLRVMFDIGRCTLRMEQPGETFPVVFEALGPDVGSLIGEATVDLRGQPVVRQITEDGTQVVQHDCRTAFDDPAFQRMLDVYGGLGAQIVTPVHDQTQNLRAIISLHHLDGPRRWTDEETDLALGAAELVGAILGSAR